MFIILFPRMYRFVSVCTREFYVHVFVDVSVNACADAYVYDCVSVFVDVYHYVLDYANVSVYCLTFLWMFIIPFSV